MRRKDFPMILIAALGAFAVTVIVWHFTGPAATGILLPVMFIIIGSNQRLHNCAAMVASLFTCILTIPVNCYVLQLCLQNTGAVAIIDWLLTASEYVVGYALLLSLEVFVAGGISKLIWRNQEEAPLARTIYNRCRKYL